MKKGQNTIKRDGKIAQYKQKSKKKKREREQENKEKNPHRFRHYL